MKRKFSLVLAVCLLLSLTACSGKAPEEKIQPIEKETVSPPVEPEIESKSSETDKIDIPELIERLESGEHLDFSYELVISWIEDEDALHSSIEPLTDEMGTLGGNSSYGYFGIQDQDGDYICVYQDDSDNWYSRNFLTGDSDRENIAAIANRHRAELAEYLKLIWGNGDGVFGPLGYEYEEVVDENGVSWWRCIGETTPGILTVWESFTDGVSTKSLTLKLNLNPELDIEMENATHITI